MGKLAKGGFALCLIALIIVSIIVSGITTQTSEIVLIKKGMSGSQVKEVQTKLKDLGYFKENIDGIYGEKTASAVKSFQSAKGLSSDGVVGDKTAKALGINVSSGSSSNSSYNGSDVYLLAKCIYAESRGEPYIGQVAVAAVVLNRVKDPDFPNSISGVIYQPWAFTAVHDGQINLEPDESSKRAARDAMNGWDPTNGCIYYYNPVKTTNKWIWSREVKLTIGRHKFAV